MYVNSCPYKVSPFEDQASFEQFDKLLVYLLPLMACNIFSRSVLFDLEFL